jgi:hypothetical protein
MPVDTMSFAQLDLEPVWASGTELTLAERLSCGELSLEFALQCATDVALMLRQMHAAGRVHGAVDGKAVLLWESHARLAAAPAHRGGSEEGDIRGFGAVLYQMVHGEAPASSFAAHRPTVRANRNDAAGVIAAATDLAYRCMARDAGAPDMQTVLMEVGLLALLSRQQAAEGSDGPGMVSTQAWQARRPEPAAVPAEGFLGFAPWMPDLTPTGQRCPQCGGDDVCKSKPRTWLESVMKRCRVPLFRCQRCYHRYFVLLRLKIAKDPTLQ